MIVSPLYGLGFRLWFV